MQDRYLFRGKRLDNGAWETGTLVIERMGTSEERYFIADKMTGYHTAVDPTTTGQCTGLKDKNGRLVFEGDIVWLFDMAKEVYQDKGAFGYWLRYEFIFFVQHSHIYWDDVTMENVEIIGNIHDNPGLLNGEV